MNTRVVHAGHGHSGAMGYKYRARIETESHKTWLGLGPTITRYRYVIERDFMGWTDHTCARWSVNKDAVKAEAEKWLDKISDVPEGEYI
jgi:hypothetical protein